MAYCDYKKCGEIHAHIFTECTKLGYGCQVKNLKKVVGSGPPPAPPENTPLNKYKKQRKKCK